MGTRVQTPAEIERLLAGRTSGLLLDTGHLTATGGDPVRATRDWRERVAHVHLKDVRLEVLEAAPTWDEAWRGGAFCELGTGGVDLEAFVPELDGTRAGSWSSRTGSRPRRRRATQIEAQEGTGAGWLNVLEAYRAP